jgi:type II secretory pathway pseudopilin PulG
MRQAIRALRSRRTRDERGFTIIETIIASMVSLIVIASVGTALIATINTSQQTSNRLDATNSGRLAMDSMTRVLRAAVTPSQLNDLSSADAAFLNGTTTSVQFYSDLQNSGNTVGPSRVTLTLSSGILTMTVQPPNAHAATDFNYQWCTPGTGCPVQTTTLARGIVTPGGTIPAVFKYYDASGNTLATPLSSTDLAAVDSIDLAVTIHIGSANIKSVTDSQYIDRVALPNHDSILRQAGS